MRRPGHNDPIDGSPTEPARLVGERARRARVASGMTVAEVAAAAGLARTTLTNIEAGSGNPTVETVWALSQALDVSFGALLQADAGPLGPVVRRREHTALTGESMDVRLLAQPSGMARVDLLDVVIKDSVRRVSDAHAAGTVEHLIVRRGVLRTGPLRETVELEVGDYASFSADEPHVYEAVGGTAEALIVICYPASMLGA